ncbi:hypothetical protein SDC9_118801 [bioreactor metagenome]|uniref:Uncharacterized protein n=1 Tax=bioreactor metagenome TaxID=1076179 RepID=A0A645C235_9ZZZZ
MLRNEIHSAVPRVVAAVTQLPCRNSQRNPVRCNSGLSVLLSFGHCCIIGLKIAVGGSDFPIWKAMRLVQVFPAFELLVAFSAHIGFVAPVFIESFLNIGKGCFRFILLQIRSLHPGLCCNFHCRNQNDKSET